MPWKPGAAPHKTKKASTPKKKRQWSKVANSMLKKGYSESRAIRAANTVAGR